MGRRVKRCRSPRVIAAAPATCSRGPSARGVCPTSPPTSTTTALATTSTSRPTPPSRRACPTSSTTAALASCSTSPPHAVGVIVNKKVGGRIMAKRVHVRVEHVTASRCREEFLNRVKKNDAAKIQAKKDGVKVVTKRQPRMPKAGFTVKKAEVLTRAPVPYDPIY